MKKFGQTPYPKDYSPPPATRGGYSSFFTKEKEPPLTGKVQGLRAAQGEERLARTIEKSIKKGLVQHHYFRSSPGIPKGVPGWKELDELVFTLHGVVAISVKGQDFVHKSSSSKQQDKLNELLILIRLQQEGINVVGNEIKTVAATDLTTQEDADRVGRKLEIYR